MSINESLESLRKALHQEIPEEKEIMALYELVKLAHFRVLTTTIEKIKFDAEEKYNAAIKKQTEPLNDRIDLKGVSETILSNSNQIQDSTYNNESINKSLNNKYAQLKVGLNDRMAYVNSLFNGSNDDFEMVICKCENDAARLYTEIEKELKKEKNKSVLFMGESKGVSKDRLELKIMEKTGWKMFKIRRKSTRP